MDAQGILNFLTQLKQNNHKEWMDAHKEEYQACREGYIQFISKLLKEISKWDEGLSDLDAKKCIFRINRDIRFSKNKAPYKLNFGASMVQGGKNSGFAGYYFHVQPGECFLGGGVYRPSADHLRLIRQEIDYNPEDFIKVVEEKQFRALFGDVWGERLSRPPKGYSKEHPQLDYLKLKSFVVLHSISDEELMGPDFLQKAVGVLKRIKPFNDYLNVALTVEN
ncbi:DUF2461 domain-containing protein [Xanthovirga aplysinae]|uniref:DUF2461 domain-containing protein n=1 Tax=Xanthovirga aplysinae TaxID=2529853 RepID=UPI0012BBF467|nr:DUF2461 domain-containing protein [Xanthovirga aplysinae]MTI31640.1 DUF2461 domain-containing protein [Xanthovirga aplysinae]